MYSEKSHRMEWAQPQTGASTGHTPGELLDFGKLLFILPCPKRTQNKTL